VAACVAKLAAWWIRFAALRADEFQFAAALVAESCIIGIIKLAFLALHFLLRVHEFNLQVKNKASPYHLEWGLSKILSES